MITVYAYKKEPNKDENYYEYLGLSTDTKSQDEKVAVNSLFLELDTGDFYYLETPAQSGTKDVLIAEQDFTGERQEGYNHYEVELNEEPFNFDKVTVVFDGVEYECQDNLERSTESDAWFSREYGAHYDDVAGEYDFSTYPFSIYCVHDEHTDQVFVGVADGNEHTIEVYVETTTPAVWKKVGSGASPSGYEINNPILTVTVESTSMVYPLDRCFINNDGYLSFEEITPSNGDSFTTLVFAYDSDDDDYNYSANAMDSSDEVNCTFDNVACYVTITDPTKDASITLSW